MRDASIPDMDPRELMRDLVRPEAYPLPEPARVEVLETPRSLLFFTEADVYKVRKAGGREASEAEVAQNGRYASGVYLGVVPIRRDPSGAASFVGDGAVVGWAVHMLRLCDDARLDTRLRARRFGDADADALAAHLAAFRTEGEVRLDHVWMTDDRAITILGGGDPRRLARELGPLGDRLLETYQRLA
jgi:aminoglycoside phosphotransferase family enzyme